MGKLVAGGDSFTYGSELKDCCIPATGTTPSKEVYSNLTYPALLSARMGLEYHCVAQPGFSNSAIRRTVMNACQNDVDLVIVTWSFPGRYEFRFNNHWEQINSWSVVDNIEEIIQKDFHAANPIVAQHHLDKLNKNRELGITEFAKVFYNHVDSYWESYDSLVDIVMLQQFLENKQIPYLFTGVDRCLLINSSRHNEESINTLLNQLNLNNWFWFPKGKGFYTWAEDNKFPFGTTHPLEEAHTEAANLIYEHFRNISRLP